MTIEGGCRCGAVRYSLETDELPPVYCCHCHDCQSWSGSAFSEQAVIREDAIQTEGPLVDYIYDTRSGAQSHQRICAICHTRIFNSNTARPGIALLRAGTLDASDQIMPRTHIWVKRKQPWLNIPPEVPVFDENAPMAEFAAIMMGR